VLYSNGFMPKAGTKDHSDGEGLEPDRPVPGPPEAVQDEPCDHVPFVTATDADFKAYKVSGIPTMAVIDRQGKVAFVKVGGGDETMLKIVVDRLLAAK
jgi:hypothetical protein